MKKIFTLLCLSFIFLGGYAQIPNASFETWTSYAGTSIFGSPFSGEYPTGWQTSDSSLQYYTAPRSAIRELTDVCNANNSVKLISVSALSNVSPGVLTNGKILSPTVITGGSPFTTRSVQFTGCYKYVPSGSDSGRVSALLSKWNGSSRDTIAFASAIVNSVPTLSNFAINFAYHDLVNSPDTILIIAASGQAVNATVAGSTLTIDNVGTAGTVGIRESSSVKGISIFPQPAQNELNIRVEMNQNLSMTYEVADITGRKIITGKMNSSSEKIDISILSKGNYFFALRNEDGGVLYTSKFIVAK